ncbi:MAG: hypothetical protein CMF50_10730 [Legionellales bacterium]|nr:hypothetical protein [Legionellales bacterium]|tara:strand:- start:8745 stop:9374 length:630 start_codon:yes stop_codon:yes gene_type:complete
MSVKFSKILRYSLIVLGLFAPVGVALAQTGGLNTPSASGVPDVDKMLANIQAQLPYLIQFITAFAYVAGFFLMFKAFFHLKQYGEMRTMMSSQADLKGPLANIFFGMALIFSPTIINVGLTTVFGDASVLSYPGDNRGWDEMGQTIVLIVNFVGGVAFIRGLFHLNKVGSGQAQQGTFAKGIIHLIGGILCLNIIGAKNVLYTTLGWAT